MADPMLKSAIKPLVPARARFELFRLRRLGPAKYREYTRLERAARRVGGPSAGRPFDIGGRDPIVLHDSTVHAVRSHWVDYGHSIKELAAFKRLAPEHARLFDVGAAEGIFSAAFCVLTGRASWAFEPSPEMFRRLGHLRAVNPQLDIRPFHIALGERPERRAVRQYPDGQYSAVGVTPRDRAQMDVTTLDAVVEAHGVAPDLLKIDVEGMELAVLKGARATLAAHVRTIVLEVHYDALAERGETLGELGGVLADASFELWSLRFEPIPDLGRYVRRERELTPGYTIVLARRAGLTSPRAARRRGTTRGTSTSTGPRISQATGWRGA
jgi:FkbM family methyltransferase